MAVAPSTAMLMDEVVEEVLFRIPPDDPMTLVHAVLVCKQWRRLVSDPGFHRRFRKFHGKPPMLGVLCNSNFVTYKSRFIPTSSFRSRHAITSEFRVVDARHGRVLLHTVGVEWDCPFAIWDPIKDEIISELPETPFVAKRGGTAAVLCANGGDCNHLHCQRGPFRVIYMSIPSSTGMFAYVYTSEDGVWTKHSSSTQRFCGAFDFIDDGFLPSELLGNALHFVFGNNGTKILKYDFTTRDASVIPTPTSSYGYASSGVLMTTEEGRLGFASVEEFRIHLWSLQQPTVDEEVDVGWAVTRVIQLPTALPAKLVGSGSSVRVLFFTTSQGIQAINMKSCKTTTISKTVGFYCVFPYMNFYPF